MRRTEQYSEKLSRLYPELHEPVGTEKILTQTVTFQVTDDCNLACKYCYQTHLSLIHISEPTRPY